jgi:hypothetical protein
MTMAAVPGILSYGPNLHIFVFEVRYLVFSYGVTPFCLHVCACSCSLPLLCSYSLSSLFLLVFALFLCFALSLLPSLLFPSWTIYFLLILSCASCAGLINQVYKVHFSESS